jgi:2-iminoacetate synthase ThiH
MRLEVSSPGRGAEIFLREAAQRHSREQFDQDRRTQVVRIVHDYGAYGYNDWGVIRAYIY